MFPIRDHNPSVRTPWVTWGLVVLNVLVFVLMLPVYGDPERLYRIYDAYALVPARITAGQDWSTLVTSIFVHAGFWHIAGNMLFLWIFGDNMEDQMGHAGFLIFYLACGIGADAAQIWADPGSRMPQIGASGAIAGVLGGYLLLFPKARVDILLFLVVFIRVFTLPAWIVLGFWFGSQLVSGVGHAGGTGGVAYWAHVGGFALGFIATLPLWLRRGGAAFWQRTDGKPPNPAATFRPTTIPRVPRQ